MIGVVTQPVLPRAILLTNLIDQEEARAKSSQEMDEMLEDTAQVFNRFGQVEQSYIVKEKMSEKVGGQEGKLVLSNMQIFTHFISRTRSHRTRVH